MVKVNPDIARYLYDAGTQALEELEQRFDTKIVLKSKEGLELAVAFSRDFPVALAKGRFRRHTWQAEKHNNREIVEVRQRI